MKFHKSVLLCIARVRSDVVPAGNPRPVQRCPWAAQAETAHSTQFRGRGVCACGHFPSQRLETLCVLLGSAGALSQTPTSGVPAQSMKG